MAWVSEVEIVNNALAITINEPINSLDDETPAAVQAKAILPMLKEKCLSRHPWRFARKRERLVRYAPDAAQASLALLYNFKNAFQMPSWLIGEPRQIIDFKNNSVNWTREGQVIFSDYTDLIIEGTQMTDVGNWPAYFQNFIVHALASEFAFIINRDAQFSIMLMNKAYGGDNERGEGGLLQIARSQDGFGEPNKSIKVVSSMLEARNW